MDKSSRIDYDFNQYGANPPVGHGNMIGWFDDDHVGTELDTLGMVVDFSMRFQILFGYNNKKILFRWRNGANWENFHVQGSR